MPKKYVDLYAVLRHLNDVWYAATPTDSMPEDVRDRARVRSEGIREAMEAVARFPAADVVAVVRCGQCKYCVEHYDTDGNVPYWTCKEWDSGTDYDGYCHYGERKDGEQDDG